MTPTPPNVLLRSEETDGVVSMIEVASSGERPGPPFHKHELRRGVLCPRGRADLPAAWTEIFTRGPGELAFAPQERPAHLCEPERTACSDARWTCTPAGFERMFDKSGPFPEVVKLGPPLESAPDTRRTE